LKGVASYLGQPHFHDRIDDEKAEEYSDLFPLTPIDPDTFQLAMEDWDIGRRWELAFTRARQNLKVIQRFLASRPGMPGWSNQLKDAL
jgi:hypothetical protein